MTEYEAKEIIALATVRGHLEGYADMLEILGERAQPGPLPAALREDAAKIERISSELRKRIPLDT